MKHFITILSIFSLISFTSFAQNNLQNNLTVEKIMQNPALQVGTSPTDIFWSEDSKTVYFYWNTTQELNPASSASGDLKLFSCDFQGNNLVELSADKRRKVEILRNGNYNANYSKKLCERNGDIVFYDIAQDSMKYLTFTTERETNPKFLADDSKIVFRRNDNLYVLNMKYGTITQITNFKTGNATPEKQATESEKWLEQQQLDLFQIVKDQKTKQTRNKQRQEAEKPKYAKNIYIQDKSLDILNLCPNARFVSFRIGKDTKYQATAVHNYVNKTGFAENLTTRPKVGTEEPDYQFGIYDIEKDTVFYLNFEKLEGLYDIPKFYADYKTTFSETNKIKRKLIPHDINWSADGKYGMMIVRSFDNKDRWILKINAQNGTYTQLNHEHDEAWIGGPGTEGWVEYAGDCGFMPDNQHFWFFSEQTGYSHLYKINVVTGEKIQITNGNFEVREAQISRNKQFWYISSGEVHAGEDHYYQMPINYNFTIKNDQKDGKITKLTNMTGGNEAVFAPNDKYIAFRHSKTNKPWEVFVQPNQANSKAKQVTKSTTKTFESYAWRVPQIITFKATDGTTVYARLYKSADSLKAKNPAVIFVHGAGYLQNAHKRWSNYYREYMFHNLLADKGYTVLDIDYRGSAGYGRDCRTGIYRHMGGKDLSDHVDGAKMLVEKYNVDAANIGIYGGSYGGFITLMALFTAPTVFKSGAALRSVTDWSHYNHGYTANILNTPTTDSLAYRRSSPIYFAEGLQGNLLICHGVVDTNVHFQDVVRLSQRLIELGKNNWEMALYPIEDHSFTEPASWTDEYKRILKLFETTLK